MIYWARQSYAVTTYDFQGHWIKHGIDGENTDKEKVGSVWVSQSVFLNHTIFTPT